MNAAQIIERVAQFVKGVRYEYPYLVNDTVRNDQIENALEDVDGDWLILKPLIASYAFLRVRGENEVVAFIATFHADSKIDAQLIETAQEGVGLIETLKFYGEEHARQSARLKTENLWNLETAVNALEDLERTTKDSKVRAECKKVRAEIEAKLNRLIDRVLRGESATNRKE